MVCLGSVYPLGIIYLICWEVASYEYLAEGLISTEVLCLADKGKIWGVADMLHHFMVF